MKAVRPKKFLGQHFLNDLQIAQKIAATLDSEACENIVEIGPGMGVLTQFLITKNRTLKVVEIDTESIAYLEKRFDDKALEIVQADFLKLPITELFTEPFAIIGNFPYNISSQILFKTIDNRSLVTVFAGMFQKEVALRVCASPGSKVYGILSVITQAFYETSYLFTVSNQVFTPPPKVESGVIKLKRKDHYKLSCNEKLFFKVVKTSFQQRRKTLWNSLKSLDLPSDLKEDAIFGKRPEQLSVQEFIDLTQRIEDGTLSAK